MSHDGSFHISCDGEKCSVDLRVLYREGADPNDVATVLSKAYREGFRETEARLGEVVVE